VTSIRRQLLRRLVGPLLLVNLGAAALTWLLAWLPGQAALDQQLAAGAAAVAAGLRPGPGGLQLVLSADALALLAGDGADRGYFAVRGARGLVAGETALLPALGHGADATVHGEPVRLATVARVVGTEPVQVAYARTVRRRLQARPAILTGLVPLAVLAGVATIGLIWSAVAGGLLPLARLRSRVDARAGADLAHLEHADLPAELQPVVAAFNDLLDRVRAGAQAQHDFLADVAHQLRTPLAGLQLQREWLAARHAHDAASGHALALMGTAIERMIRQTNQLLALARAEPSRFEPARCEPVDLEALVGEAVQVFVEKAGRKAIDLGFELARAPLLGDPFLVRDLIDNLIDHAIRYTPEGGHVTVSCGPDRQGGVRLAVADSGPGIPAAERARGFSRHVRLSHDQAGCGLGLAIVRSIAATHHAEVELDSAPGGGARFTVRFPAP
jgi:two-component system sensor histidine kinase TctE